MTLTALASPAPRETPASPTHRALALCRAADTLLPLLVQGVAVDARAVRAAMEAAFRGSDAQGLWDWKDAYEACEAAQLLFLRRFGPALSRQPSAAQLAMISKIAGLLPSQTRRSQESQALQQFSTPTPLAWIAARAAGLGAGDLVLEPSAGTGLLAIFAEIAGAELALNELGDGRAELLGRLFPASPVSRFDAAHIHDHLDAAVIPTVVLMNPPFSAGAHVQGRVADAALRHMASALARLADGGRLVAITGAGLSPHNAAWRDAFSRLQQRGRILFSAAIDGSVYARHGTTTETRLTIIDRTPAEDPDHFPDSPGMAANAAQLLAWVDAHVPPRGAVTPVHPTRRLCSKPALHRAASAPTGSATGADQRPAAWLHGVRLEPACRRPADRSALRALCPAIDRHRGRQVASHPAGAVGLDGVGLPAQARLCPAPARRTGCVSRRYARIIAHLRCAIIPTPQALERPRRRAAPCAPGQFMPHRRHQPVLGRPPIADIRSRRFVRHGRRRPYAGPQALFMPGLSAPIEATRDLVGGKEHVDTARSIEKADDPQA